MWETAYFRQKRSPALLFVGYIGYYPTRKNITVAQVSMKDLDLLTTAQIGYLSSAGTLAYAAGKFINGFLTDWLGGKRTFLLGMLGSVIATSLFASAGGLPLFMAAWIVNSYFLSMGWGGLIKIMSCWYGKGERGMVVGLMTVTFQLGSSIAKVFSASLTGFPLLVWKGLFLVPALVLLALALAMLFFLEERPPFAEEPEPTATVSAVNASSSDETSLPTAWWLLFRSPAFLLILWASATAPFSKNCFCHW
jgi:sugar phosphate permease